MLVSIRRWMHKLQAFLAVPHNTLDDVRRRMRGCSNGGLQYCRRIK